MFLDDDVIPGPTWADDLALDLAGASVATAGIAARIDVPLPSDRRPTDWERHTAGLAGARWITADLVYRRRAGEEDTVRYSETSRRARRRRARGAERRLRCAAAPGTGTGRGPWWQKGTPPSRFRAAGGSPGCAGQGCCGSGELGW